MKNLIILAAVFLSSCAPIMKWQEDYPDNEVEEYIEDIIKEKTGKDIDLTPVTGDERQAI